MDETPDDVSTIDRLCRKGDPRDTWRWHEGDPDYVTEFRLRPVHIPALVEMDAAAGLQPRVILRTKTWVG